MALRIGYFSEPLKEKKIPKGLMSSVARVEASELCGSGLEAGHFTAIY